MAPFIQDSSFEGTPVFDRILGSALDGDWVKRPIGDLVGAIAKSLIDTPYVGWTLERNADREFCFVTLEGLDCVTLFESSLGMARMLKRWTRDVASKATPNVRIRRPLPSDLVEEIAFTRYRGGKVGDYSSRLHYTTDWIHDNVEKGVVESLAESLKGSKKLGKTIDFMSSHPDTYRQLKAHPELLPRIKDLERAISQRDTFFVPTASLAAQETKLKTGDIVGLVTTLPGMDIAHTGLIIREGASARFLHASSTQKKVVLDARISEVASSRESYLGIVVARPLELD
jgi:hypothetical protein